MTKTRKGKLRTAVVALAICLAMVFSCAFTAFAAEGNAYHTWSNGTLNETGDQATIDLTLTAPSELSDGIRAANFQLNYPGLSLIGVDVISGQRTDSSAFNASDVTKSVNTTIGGVALVSSNSYKSLTVRIKFSCNTQAGDAFVVSIVTDTLSFAGPHDECQVTAQGPEGKITLPCLHTYGLLGRDGHENAVLYQTNTLDGYYVYNGTRCIYCGQANPYSQYVPANEYETILYWSGTCDNTNDKPTKRDNDGNLLITTAEELAYVAHHNVEDNYKIADGIEAIVLQPKEKAAEIMALQDYSETKAYFEAGSGWYNWYTKDKAGNGATSKFRGTFDGNGVTIYGLYSYGTDYGGLFGEIVVDNTKDATIKNLYVKNAYIKAVDDGIDQSADGYAGAIAARLTGGDTYTTNLNAKLEAEDWGFVNNNSTARVNFEKCAVSSCYIESGWGRRVGVMVGNGDNFINVTVRNSLVYGSYAVLKVKDKNTEQYVVTEQGLFGSLSTAHDGSDSAVENKYNNTEIFKSIIFDCSPYAVEPSTQAFKPSGYDVCYTNYAVTKEPNTHYKDALDQYNDRIFVVKKNDAKGDKAMTTLSKLNWGTEWFANSNSGYPTFEKKDLGYDHNEWKVYWEKGGIDTTLSGSGTEQDPYIISSAEELCAVTRGKVESEGRYFKVADGIRSFHLNKFLQEKGGAVFWVNEASPFETAINTFNDTWTNAVGEDIAINFASGQDPFEGHFDGNGATIYGLVSEGQHNTGLFPVVSGNVTIKNISVEKGYASANISAGAIVGHSQSGSLTIENCSVSEVAVKSTYTSHSQGIGAIFGRASENVTVKNCIVNIEDRYFDLQGAAIRGGLGGYAENPANYENCIVLGVTPYSVNQQTSGDLHQANTSDAAIYTNVYTDAEVKDVKVRKSGTDGAHDFSDSITKITPDDVKGLNALNNLPENWDWDTWNYGGYLEYPTPVPQKIASYSSRNLKLLAANISYNENGTFNLNFYYNPSPAGIVPPVLYVGRDDGIGLKKLEAEVINPTVASTLGFDANTLCYTLQTIPAREIERTYLLTAISRNVKTTVWGPSEEFSVAKYARAIINEENNIKWIETTNPEKKEADKQVAAALVNYGVAARIALETPNKNNTTATNIQRWEAIETLNPDVDYEDWGLVDDELEGSGEPHDPYIITNARELCAVTRGNVRGGTKGKYFKVADGITAFSLGRYMPSKDDNAVDNLLPWIDENTPFENIIKRNKGEWWVQGTAAGSKDVPDNFLETEAGVFEGHFDGNGATIYGLFSFAASTKMPYAGLFPRVQGDVTIKNINIKKAYIHGINSAGGIVGKSYGEIAGKTDSPSKEAAGSLTIENCTVTESYIESALAVGDFFGEKTPIDTNLHKDEGIGAILGSAYNANWGEGNSNYQNGSVRIKNCLVDLNSEYFVTPENAPNYNRGGICGVSKTSDIKFENSIIMGVNPYTTIASTSSHKEHQWTSYRTDKDNHGFVNIYTDAQVENVVVGGGDQKDPYTFTGIKKIEPDYINDMSVMNRIPEFDWGNVWIPNASGYPKPIQSAPLKAPESITDLPEQYKEAYSQVKFDKYNDYGDSTDAIGLYVTSLNLKNNPILSLTFTFAVDNATGINYKANRADVEIAVSTNTGYFVKTNPPVYEKDVYVSNVITETDTSGTNGWTNKKNAGKYHMYDLNDLSVYDLAEEIDVQMSYGDETKVTSTVSLSGFGNELLISYQKSGGNEYYYNCAEAVRALLFYVQSLKARQAL